MLYQCCWGTLEADRPGASGTRVEAPALMCGLATVEALSLLQDARPWDTHDVRHGGPALWKEGEPVGIRGLTSHSQWVLCKLPIHHAPAPSSQVCFLFLHLPNAMYEHFK